MNTNKKFFISAGDISGDIHAANLIKAIKNISDIYVCAVGGTQLKTIANDFIDDKGAGPYCGWNSSKLLSE